MWVITSKWLRRLPTLAALGVVLGALWLMPPSPDRPRQPTPVSDRPTLLVFDSPSCVWCHRFRESVAPSYERSALMTAAPLRYILVTEQRASGYLLAARVQVTPTFVLVDKGGREIERLIGYPGSPDVFLPKVRAMLGRLKGATS